MTFHPPLGVTTRLFTSARTLYFTHNSTLSEGKVPEVWTNLPSGEWKAYELHESETAGFFVSVPLQTKTTDDERFFEYTYRYRNPDGQLEWLGSEGGNGQIIVSRNGGGIVNASVRVEVVQSQSRSPDETGEDLLDILSKLDLGAQDLQGASVVVLEQSKPTWLVPRLLPSHHDPLSLLSPSFPVAFLLLRLPPSSKNPMERWLACLPLLSPRSSGSSSSIAIGVAPIGKLSELIDTLVQEGGQSLAAPLSNGAASNGHQELSSSEGISWCTYNALGTSYTLSGVLSAVKELRSGNTLHAQAITTVLLDDGWQDVRSWKEEGRLYRALRSFETRQGWYDIEGGKGTLKDAVAKIKQLGIERVVAWLAIAGYWDGLDNTSDFASRYILRQFTLSSPAHPNSHLNGPWYIPSSRFALSEFYRDYFTHLRSSGIDGVKIDDQAHAEHIVSCEDTAVDVQNIRTAIREEAIRAAHEIFGAGIVTHCMAGSPTFFGSALALSQSSSSSKDILRASDDYFPNEPSSHSWHVLHNAYISLLARSFPSLRIDFDMCEEAHEFGEYHLALRSFQTAPILSTDKPGTVVHGASWDRLLAKRKDGRVETLHSRSQAGAILEGRIGEDVTAPGNGPGLKLAAHDEATGGARIGIWNTRGGSARSYDTIDSRDVSQALGCRLDESKAESYVLFRQRDGVIVDVSREELLEARGSPRISARPLLEITLAEKQVEILSVAPVWTIGEGQVACLGLLGKYAGATAIQSIGKASKASKLTTSVPSSAVEQVSGKERDSNVLATRPLPPQPQGRLPTLLASLLPTLLFPSRSSLRVSRQQTARQFLSDLYRSPGVTLWRELSGLIGFAVGVVVWTFAVRLRGRGTRRQGSLPPPSQVEDVKNEASIKRVETLPPNESSQTEQQNEEVLKIVTPYTGRLDFVLRPGSQGRFVFTVDGTRVTEEKVKRTTAGKDLYELDLEDLGQQHGGEEWIIEVSY